MKKTLKVISLFLASFFVLVVFLHFIGVTNTAIDFARKLHGNEINVGLFRIVASLIVVAIILSSCLIASAMARKKGRQELLWIVICIFINYWGVLILHYLPPQAKTKTINA